MSPTVVMVGSCYYRKRLEAALKTTDSLAGITAQDLLAHLLSLTCHTM